MKFSTKTIALTVMLALGAVPAFALPPPVPSNQGTAHKPATPGANATAASKGRAYGKHCADQSKKHVAGEKGTAFSRCVTAMAKVANSKVNPTTACKTESKKHVAGEKGTPFSRCVKGAAKLQETLRRR